MVKAVCSEFIFTMDPSTQSQENKIKSGSVNMQSSIVCAELSIDTMTLVVNSTCAQRIQAGETVPNILDLKYGEKITIYQDEEILAAFYLIEEPERIGPTSYRIRATSSIGLLENIPHYGGIYSEGISFEDLIASIIPQSIPYSVDESLAKQMLYGWLPIANCRSNLKQVLFAMGASVRKSENGEISFVFLDTSVTNAIPNSRRYIAGSKSPQKPASKVQITEHTYIKYDSTEPVVLFDNSESGLGIVSNQRVKFNGPHHTLTTSGDLTLVESGANYAVVTGAGQLLGKPYTHQENIIEKVNPTPGLVENIKTVPNATLVSMLNSENVAERVLSYFSGTSSDTLNLVVGSERPGDMLEYTDAFYEVTKGIMSSMEISLSKTLKARVTTLKGYTPTGQGNLWSRNEIFTEDGSWAVPEGVYSIRVVLISGGQGGYSGAKGKNGTGASGSNYGNGGDGGAKGQGGIGGRIFISTIDVQPGETFSVSIGVGGSGGVCSGTENTPGADGTDTTFGAYTSADGVPSSIGYIDPISGITYGTMGLEGISDGGNGVGSNYPQGETLIINGVTYVPGAFGENESRSGTNPNGERWSGTAYGGAGGGPAYGANGGDGGDGSASNNNGWGFFDGGFGGNGAKASITVSPATIPGAGGQGGSGGGGGGGGGPAQESNSNGGWPGSAGNGGLGSNGGKGANGVLIIYY